MLNWINRKMKRKGFTLIEMVIVIAILGILIAIAVPRLAGFRERAQDSADKATAATIAKAAEMYIATNDVENENSINVIDLYNANLIDADYDGFYLEWSGNQFIVKKGDTNGDILYPAD